MNMQELVNKLSATISKAVAKEINPLVENKHDLTAIESAIDNCFATHKVLEWCCDQVNVFDKKGVIFYNQFGVWISAKKVCELLENDEFVNKAKNDIKAHYGKIVPRKIIPAQCGVNSRLVAHVYGNGKLKKFECETLPKRPDDQY